VRIPSQVLCALGCAQTRASLTSQAINQEAESWKIGASDLSCQERKVISAMVWMLRFRPVTVGTTKRQRGNPRRWPEASWSKGENGKPASGAMQRLAAQRALARAFPSLSAFRSFSMLFGSSGLMAHTGLGLALQAGAARDAGCQRAADRTIQTSPVWTALDIHREGHRLGGIAKW
jgi:hypothetical protein